jgi:hypothetical protein
MAKNTTPKTTKKYPPLKNAKWEMFARAFVDNDNGANTFNNATRSYAFAHEIDLDNLDRDDAKYENKKDSKTNQTYRVCVQKSSYDRQYFSCATMGKRLFKTVQIRNRINDLMNMFFEDNHAIDRELSKVIKQDKHLTAKTQAIKLHADIKGRIIAKNALTDTEGNDILPDSESMAKSFSAIEKLLTGKSK